MGCCLIDVCVDEIYDDEPFMTREMVIDLIASTGQEANVQILKKSNEMKYCCRNNDWGA